MQKTRPRRTGKQKASSSTGGGAAGDAPDSAGRGRTAHVRNRLIVAVAVVAAAIAGAGAPTILTASGQLNDSQNLVTLAQRTQQALTLAHSLADERDEVTSYIAAGRPKAKAPSEQRGARVDRQVEELRADEDAPAALLTDLDAIASLRRAALTGKSTALEAHQSYSGAITELHALAEDLAEQVPPRAGSGAHSLAELDTAVQQSAAARGLLLAALSIPRTTETTTDPYTGLTTTTSVSSEADTKQRDALSAAAQQARLRSDAALAGFRETAPKADKTSYDSTVTGPDVTNADKYLSGLTDQPTISDAELDTSTKKLDAALSARVELMRGAEASLNSRRIKDLEALRDDDVTALEIRIALIGTLLLVAVGVSMAMARSLTRPLAVLRLGSARLAADPGAQEPVKFTGRNDEFAQVVRSVNALHTHAASLHERLTTLEGDRKHLIGQRQLMADERDKLRVELAEAAAHLEQARGSIHGTFVNLALRTLGLVERQLGVIEGLEEREQDPDRLATLFKLDHFATVMRRHSENLLILAGAEHGQQHAAPVPLVDVVRAAVSEIERYERVRIATLPPHAHLAGFAADDISHLVAELLENASSFSPPDMAVEVSGWLLENGEVMLSVQDEGIGMTTERMKELNSRLAEFDPADPYDQESGEGLGLGLYVVARLAHRHGVRVQLREQKQGGIAAVAVLPGTLLTPAPSTAVPSSTPAAAATPAPAPALTLPGADAEANSNVLYGRSTLPAQPPAGDEDPFIAAAEEAVRGAAAGDADEGAPAPSAPEPTPETTMELLAPVLPVFPVDEPVETRGEPWAGQASAAGPAGTEGEAGPAETATHPGSAAEGGTATTGTAVVAGPVGAPEAAPAVPTASAGLVEPAAPLVPTALELAAEPAPESPEASGPRPFSEPGDAPRTTPTPDPYAIGPDAHERVPDVDVDESESERVTDKGLPKRTPKISTPVPAPRPRTGGVDAEALRRRLGGFHRGAQEGRREVEAEIADQTAELNAPAHDAGPHAQDVEPSGGTVEEASS
ncbi:nitrate- and nitrite sensing domain-containing protein [Streptomyces sp. NBC_00038]|uniref:sensor histidine kinase n=1 Tax=Streptomyces sp. NBC_00038 TaxID=2903615 RepID=UPI00224DF36E|nr:nitrate- and nitrite sensing domain-containing protein [Streptomyces sp. NBC_00038]MCX5560703.1 nitrate- and nitrite sensing domain-containing protein [Streptomyces sp. NBC_00038]